MRLPKRGTNASSLMSSMRDIASKDMDWKEKLAAGVSYPAGDDVQKVAEQAYIDFFSVNALYPNIFPSTAKFEQEVVAMTANLLHGENAVGAISSGGTESNLLSVKSARDRAKKHRPNITEPEIVAPESAHPSFNKAAEYFGLTLISTPLTPDGLVDVDSYHQAVTKNTVLMVGTAPSTLLGMIDPIDEMATVAYEREISFHVDACVGGYFLPFKEKLGHDVRLWDFRVPGVTTISADLHKFGYTAKGASAIISRDPDIYQYQIFDFGPPKRPSGYYQTPTIAGSRPGGAIAAAWAVMNYLGEEGYMRLVEKTMNYIQEFQDRINAIEGLFVMGKPDMSVFAYGSNTLDIYAVATGMEDKGWMVSKDSIPFEAIHFMQSPGHEPFVADYLNDLEEVVELVAQGEITARGPSANYN